MKQLSFIWIFLILFVCGAGAQINYTANDPGSVKPYTGDFLYGSNMGYYPPWTNQTIADIAAGNPAKNVKGAGVKSLHLPLPEDFLEKYTYDVSINDFIHYHSLGIKDNTVFLEFPTAAHTDKTIYPGNTSHSLIWDHIYQPIWDGGANGTPVNDDNYLALYVYNTVIRYKQWVKFWELVNEPDFDGGQNGWKSPTDAGNWWTSNPQAGQLYNLKAPIFNYIRMLRITYEVIKTVDPSAYVSMGGVGYPSFLDAILRNTDNPADGSVNASYPVKGGAYFDCMSFHYYPMYDLRYFDNTGTLRFNRHSDAAIHEYLGRKNTLDSVLKSRGYNGNTYPEKVFINTENNIARKPIGDYVGGDEVQRNYDMKALVESQLNDIKQFYVFSIGDSKTYAEATDPFEVVGLYQPLTGIGPVDTAPGYRQQYNNSGIAYKTFSDVLSGFRADLPRTAALSLPAGVRGGAFKNSIGDYVYVLWAATTTDNSEAASATYSFPPAISLPQQVDLLSWDYAKTQSAAHVSPQNIALTGSPSLILAPMVITPLYPDTLRNSPAAYFSFSLYPNPVRDKLTVKLHLKKREQVSINVTDGMGHLVMQVADKTLYSAGDNTISLSLPARLANGLYYCRLVAGNNDQTIKFIVSK